jgi:hypothetical protein
MNNSAKRALECRRTEMSTRVSTRHAKACATSAGHGPAPQRRRVPHHWQGVALPHELQHDS